MMCRMAQGMSVVMGKCWFTSWQMTVCWTSLASPKAHDHNLTQLQWCCGRITTPAHLVSPFIVCCDLSVSIHFTMMTKLCGENRRKYHYLGLSLRLNFQAECFFHSNIDSLPCQNCMVRYPTKCNRLPCVVDVEHLLQNLQITRWSSMCPWRLCRTLRESVPGFLLNEQKSLVGDILGCVHSVKAMEAVFDNFVFLHEGTSSDTVIQLAWQPCESCLNWAWKLPHEVLSWLCYNGDP